jgi:glycosyltransferase involved in cell wall biosynthesis
MAAAVDIILPTHRRPHTVAYAVDAVLRQTYPHFALHVVGDGCDDATEAALRVFDDPRLHAVRFAKARGFGYANRNRVLHATAAPFVAYATDDDLWLPDHLERALAALEERRVELVAMRSAHVDVPDVLDPHFFAFDWRLPVLSTFLRNWFVSAPTLVHRRSLFGRIGYWNDQLSRFGDREFFNRARATVPTAYVDSISVLRFYALHWDAHYAELAAPPQQRYLPRIADPAWCARLRAAAAPGARPLAVRRRQCADAWRFAVRSGPKFVRFWYERWTSHGTGRTADERGPSHERSG